MADEKPKKRSRPKKKRSEGGFLPSVVIFGIPLFPLLAGLVVLGCVITGSIFLVRASIQPKQKKDWSKDFDLFFTFLQNQEEERTVERQPITEPGRPYPPSWLFGYDATTPEEKRQGKQNIFGLTHQKVEWTGTFLGMGEAKWTGAFSEMDKPKTTLKFDLRVNYQTEGKLAQHQPGADYSIVFFPAATSLDEWKAVAVGTKVQFSGLIGNKDMKEPAVFVIAEGWHTPARGMVIGQNVKVHERIDGGAQPSMKDPIRYIIQINVSDVKVLKTLPAAKS